MENVITKLRIGIDSRTPRYKIRFPKTRSGKKGSSREPLNSWEKSYSFRIVRYSDLSEFNEIYEGERKYDSKNRRWKIQATPHNLYRLKRCFVNFAAKRATKLRKLRKLRKPTRQERKAQSERDKRKAQETRT